MNIDNDILDKLTAEAMVSPRLRRNYDLRTTPDDTSQRMLNAIEPGAQIPIHRHNGSTELVILLRGRAIQYCYDDEGHVTEAILLVPSGQQVLDTAGAYAVSMSCSMMSVEVGRWHRLESLEHGTVIFECKDGAYEPIDESDILNIENDKEMEQKELIKKIYEWVEFQMRSNIGEPYRTIEVARNLGVAEEDVIDAMKADEKLLQFLY